jgi:hypothetical protein
MRFNACFVAKRSHRFCHLKHLLAVHLYRADVGRAHGLVCRILFVHSYDMMLLPLPSSLSTLGIGSHEPLTSR